MTHTPGPWELDEDYGVAIVGLPGYEGDPTDRRVVLSICEPDEMYYWEGMDEEDHANIALMMAAPDLLEACEAAKAKLEVLIPGATNGLPADGDVDYELILAAIRKATGGL